MEQNVLIFNVGSSSLSSKVFSCNPNAADSHSVVVRTVVGAKGHRVMTKSTEKPFIEYKDASGHCIEQEERDEIPTHAVAASAILAWLERRGIKIDCIGHRFVHCNGLFGESTLITPSTLAQLRTCVPLAPIHNPMTLAVIDVCLTKYGDSIPQYVTFDTAFHSNLPPEAYTYALPHSLSVSRGYRKFGFHGLSYQYVTEALAHHGVTTATADSSSAASSSSSSSLEQRTRVVACHLGTGGSSAAAICGGKTVDTSMGWGTVPGLVMSTRCGDLDPGIVIDMVAKGMTPGEVSTVLSKESGLVGLTDGLTSDLRDVFKVATEQPQHEKNGLCGRAFDVYVHRLVSVIGSLVAVMGGVDVLAFTDDLGFNMWQLREAVCERLAWLGVSIDKEANAKTVKNEGLLENSDVALIQSRDSKVVVAVVVNDEEVVVARESKPFLKK